MVCWLMITTQRDSNSQLGQRLLEPGVKNQEWKILFIESVAPILPPSHEQHHSFPSLRSSSRLVIADMVDSSNAEKPEAIDG